MRLSQTGDGRTPGSFPTAAFLLTTSAPSAQSKPTPWPPADRLACALRGLLGLPCSASGSLLSPAPGGTPPPRPLWPSCAWKICTGLACAPRPPAHGAGPAGASEPETGPRPSSPPRGLASRPSGLRSVSSLCALAPPTVPPGCSQGPGATRESWPGRLAPSLPLCSLQVALRK